MTTRLCIVSFGLNCVSFGSVQELGFLYADRSFSFISNVVKWEGVQTGTKIEMIGVYPIFSQSRDCNFCCRVGAVNIHQADIQQLKHKTPSISFNQKVRGVFIIKKCNAQRIRVKVNVSFLWIPNSRAF